jgi:UDP-N-acetyl-D-glucosamine dehydrogenase
VSLEISPAAERSPLVTGLRPVVCVQGLGFVGTAMALAVANAREADGAPAYDVVGVELPTPEGERIVRALEEGRMPIESSDPKMQSALETARDVGNLTVTTDGDAYTLANVALVSINFDLAWADGEPTVNFDGLRAAVRTLAERMPPGSLIVVETTVPPGTTELILGPEVDDALGKRGLAAGAIEMAYSYERVMPGAQYFDSVVNFWRVYAGLTTAAADACESFLSKVISTERFPLTRVSTTTAAEMGKVLENSYRAANIAFMEEWGRFAEAVGVDLFEVIDAIRVRPTHSNMRQPGFGVGGYCLTKDPLFAKVAARELFGLEDLRFAFSEEAVRLNNTMPLVTLEAVERLIGGSLDGMRILLLGVSYREGVGDTRFSPSAAFAGAAAERGAEVVCHDPIVTDWEGDGALVSELPSPDGFDAVVFAVGHPEYRRLDMREWIGGVKPAVVDANHVLREAQVAALVAASCPIWAIGRGQVAP